MTDLRELVATVIDESAGEYDNMHVDSWKPRQKLVRQADAAIAVAEPIIRAQVIEELIAAAHEQGVEYVCSGYASSLEEQMDIADWLRAQGEKQ